MSFDFLYPYTFSYLYNGVLMVHICWTFLVALEENSLKKILLMFMHAFTCFWNIRPFFLCSWNPFDCLAFNLLERVCRVLHGFYDAFSDLFKSFWPSRFEEIIPYLKNNCLKEFEIKLPFAFLIVMGRTLDFFLNCPSLYPFKCAYVSDK